MAPPSPEDPFTSVAIYLGKDATPGVSMLDYPYWHPTSRSSITRNDDGKNVDRTDVHSVVEETDCGEPADQAARVVLSWNLEGGVQVPDLLSLDRIMECNREYLR